jgi:orotate phosphoribosyltransferase
LKPSEAVAVLQEIGAIELRVKPEEWFTWTSGKRAPIYCDNRLLMSFPEQRAEIADALVHEIRRHHPDVEVIAGTATAGIPHAAWVAERMGLPMVYVRGSAKGHGKQKRVEGRALSGERVVVVEDLISTGGSSAASVEALRENGGVVVGVQAIFSYGFPRAEELFQSLGVPASALTSYEVLVEAMDLDEATTRILLDWRSS